MPGFQLTFDIPYGEDRALVCSQRHLNSGPEDNLYGLAEHTI